ncbi:MAG: SHD1 domain-containing protein [Verrucomicrobiota bacterium]
MKLPFCLPALIGLTFSSAALAESSLRTWTNSEGRTITAELVELNDGVATLRMENGRRYEVSLETLSEADNEFAAEWTAAKEAEARAGEMGTILGDLGDVIVETTFDEDTPPTRKGDVMGWKAGIGEWRIEDGMLIGDEVPEDDHASSITTRFEAAHLIIQAQVQLGSSEQIAFACRDTVAPGLHLGRLYLTPDKLWIQNMTGISKTTTAERLITVDVELDPEEWYDVTIEIVGDTFRATVGEHELEASHSRFTDTKGIIALTNRGQGAKFRKVAIWHAEPKSS